MSQPNEPNEPILGRRPRVSHARHRVGRTALFQFPLFLGRTDQLQLLVNPGATRVWLWPYIFLSSF
jgi:hypothetical protein